MKAYVYSRWFPWLIFCFAELFCMVQSSLQLSTGLLFEPIMHDFAVSAFYASLLNSVYYYIYVGFQIPAGLVMDKIGPRRLLFAGAFICSLGCLVFSLTTVYTVALLAKFFVGGAAAVAFVGVLYVIREWFPPEKKSTLVAMAEIFTMVSSIRGVFVLAIILQRFDWRVCMQVFSFYFCLIAIACGLLVRDHNPAKKNMARPIATMPLSQSFLLVVRDKVAWLNGLYIGLMFTVVTVFIALWATPFLKVHLGVTSIEAAKIALLTFGGVFFGCPLFGWLSEKYQCRRKFLIFSGASSSLLLGFIIYWPHVPIVVESVALFLLGLVSSGYVLSFLISDDIAPAGVKNTYMGFTNACCMITAPILQPVIGALLDAQLGEQGAYSCDHFENAFLIMIGALLLATVIAWVLPETFGQEKMHLRKDLQLEI